MDPSIEQLLREFVVKRIELIRTHDRLALDSTYDLACRNEYNRHDYDWYMRLIEFGFGAEVQKFEIEPVSHDTRLPFSKLVTWTWPPEYAVYLTAVDQRHTVWWIFVNEEGPKVALPAFNGRIGDAIACGELGPRGEGQQGKPEVVFRFDEDQFAHELAERIYLELNGVKIQLQYDEIRALAIDCHPWFGSLNLCILTGREDFSVEEDGKWSIADWRYFDFTSTPNENWPYAKDLIQQMKAYYDSSLDEDRASCVESIFRACAKALLSPAVSRSLEFYGFKLTSDFEFGVFDHDHPEKGNYCTVVGADKSDDELD